MTRHGPMSIEDYRAWVATYGNWTPSKKRPGDSQVEHVMRQLATALERPEAEIVEDVTARADYDATERARLDRWARQALTIVVLAAERAGSSGTRLSDNVLFHELALRWSPTYVKAVERGPGHVPSEMRRDTLQAARDDLKAAGFRLQRLFELVTQGVAGWYKTRSTAKGRRVVLRGRPLKGRVRRKIMIEQSPQVGSDVEAGVVGALDRVEGDVDHEPIVGAEDLERGRHADDVLVDIGVQVSLALEARVHRQSELLAEQLKVPSPACFQDQGVARVVVGEDILIVDTLGCLRPAQQAERS